MLSGKKQDAATIRSINIDADADQEQVIAVQRRDDPSAPVRVLVADHDSPRSRWARIAWESVTGATLARFFHLGFVNLVCGDSHVGKDRYMSVGNHNEPLADSQKLLVTVFDHDRPIVRQKRVHSLPEIEGMRPESSAFSEAAASIMSEPPIGTRDLPTKIMVARQ
jgi:hypothetical protein